MIAIRRAHPRDLAACRALLPECHSPATFYLVAADSKVIGAAAFHRIGETIRILGVAVEERHRGHGIGSRLLAETARLGGSIIAAFDAVKYPLAAGWIESRQFVYSEGVTSVEAPLQPVLDDMSARIARIRHRIPKNVRIANLAEADQHEIAKIWAREVMRRPSLSIELAMAEWRLPEWRHSLVIFGGTALAAFALIRVSGSQLEMRANYVAAGFRSSWAGVLLRYEAVRRAVECGCSRAIYQWNDGVRDTQRAAVRGNARVTARHLTYAFNGRQMSVSNSAGGVSRGLLMYSSNAGASAASRPDAGSHVP